MFAKVESETQMWVHNGQNMEENILTYETLQKCVRAREVTRDKSRKVTDSGGSGCGKE